MILLLKDLYMLVFFFIFGEVLIKLEIVLEMYFIERRCKGIIFDKKRI